MTLQLRRKRPIIRLTTKLVTACSDKVSKPLLKTSATLLLCSLSSWLNAQEWQPTRVSASPVRHISDATQPTSNRVVPAQHTAPKQRVSSAVRWQPDRTHAAYQPQFTSVAAGQKQPSQAGPAPREHAVNPVFEAAVATPDNNTKVNLRWISKDSAENNGGQPETAFPEEPAFSDIAPVTPPRQIAHQPQASSQVIPASYPHQNSLRTAQSIGNAQEFGTARASSAPVQQAGYSEVRTASYQDTGELQFGDLPELPELGATDSGLPELAPPPPAGTEGVLPEVGGAYGDLGSATEGMDLQNGEPPTPPSTTGELPSIQPSDQLQFPEDAPPPADLGDRPQNPFAEGSPQSPSDGGSAEQLDSLPNPRQGPLTDPDLTLPDRSANSANAPTCSELRERLRQRPISRLSLNTAPVYGEGLRSVGEDNEDSKLSFAANSPVRDWRDVSNKVIARGRLIDLRNEQVVLDVDGREMTLDLLKLSDTDVGYVGDAWNIPASCGVGNVAFEGRQFVASTVQFNAPGNCHKPLYFQQSQLERYGHTAGPIVQPLISTAHFFGNIAVLPYNMGIHPPNECQYSLGYYRPGNCAPYMLEPIPISLRGALSQAVFTTGLSGLIP